MILRTVAQASGIVDGWEYHETICQNKWDPGAVGQRMCHVFAAWEVEVGISWIHQRLWVSLPTSIKNHPDSGPIKIHPVSINKLHQTCSKISWNSGAPAGKDYMAFIFNLFEKNPQAHGLGLEMTWASINITFGKRREDEDNVLSYVS